LTAAVTFMVSYWARADLTSSIPAAFGIGTLAYGINPQRDIVGLYSDGSGNTHGFLLKQDREDDWDREHDR
jgi:hypothetical protein